jgi:hypothetical protein
MNPTPPFHRLAAIRPTFGQRLLRRRPRQNAFVEVNNLIADAARVRDVPREAVSRVCAEYRTNLYREFGGAVERLYRSYLEFCLRDRRLTSDELADLAHLQHILGLDDACVKGIHEHVAQEVYCKSVNEVLEDGTLDASERAFLQRLRENLGLSERVADRIMELKTRQREPGDR